MQMGLTKVVQIGSALDLCISKALFKRGHSCTQCKALEIC